MKRFTLIVLSLILVFSIIGCSSQTTSQDSTGEKGDSSKTYKIKIANWHAPEHAINLALNKFKDDVEKKTEGKIEVEIYPNSQLGPEDTYIDSVKQGMVEMGVTGMLMGRDVPMINIGELPLLFNDWDHAQKVFQGPLGDEMTNGIVEKAGVRNLAWLADGFRVVSSNKAVKKFEDFNGLRLRVPNTPTYVEMAKQWGANPLTMAFSEVFTGLEQNVVDAQENPYSTIRSSKFYEVQDYIIDTKHMFSPRLWVVNDKFFNSLPEEYQTIISDSAKEAAAYEWEELQNNEIKDLKYMQEQGVELITLDDNFKNKLRESQKPVYDWFYNEYPGSKELAEKIRKVVE